MKDYTALIIDLKKSRTYSIEMRNNIQEYIIDIIHAMNDMFSKSLMKNVDFSAGDEIQGLFSSTEAAYLYFRMFSMIISPLEVRAGIGVGRWDVVVERAGTTAQDGQAYHYARYAIDSTEESLGYSVLLFSNRKTDIVFNSLINSTALIINRQSEYQNEVMLLSELLYPINAYNIIDILKLDQLIQIIREKKQFMQYELPKMRHTDKTPLFYRINGHNFNYKPTDAFDDNNNFFVTGGKVRGMSSQLAKLIGVSRQSVEKTIKTANIYEARNLAVTTLIYMQNIGEIK